jgi:hypothetical protein
MQNGCELPAFRSVDDFVAAKASNFNRLQQAGRKRFNTNHLESTRIHRLQQVMAAGSGSEGRAFGLLAGPSSSRNKHAVCSQSNWRCKVQGKWPNTSLRASTNTLGRPQRLPLAQEFLRPALTRSASVSACSARRGMVCVGCPGPLPLGRRELSARLVPVAGQETANHFPECLRTVSYS